MDIEVFPLLQDNYAYLLSDAQSGCCAVVDPSEGPKVAAAIARRKLRLTCVLATHHHADHVGGIPELRGPGVEVICSTYDRARVPGATRFVDDGARLEVLGSAVEVLAVPGHTLGAVAYHLPEQRALFTGDTLFLAGCGRLFEGDAAQMHASFARLAALDPQTAIYCGHEYTEKNLQFALSLEPDAAALQARLATVRDCRGRGAATVPGTVEEERRTNPFMRAAALQASLGVSDPVAAFAALRARRDRF